MFSAFTDELWIGLNDRKTEGLFDWSDHATVSFTSWEYGKPASATNTKDCVFIRGKVKQRGHGSYISAVYNVCNQHDNTKKELVRTTEKICIGSM